MKEPDKSALMEIWQILGRFHMLTVKACSETDLFRDWSNQDFHSLYFRKYISYDNHPFLQNL